MLNSDSADDMTWILWLDDDCSAEGSLASEATDEDEAVPAEAAMM